MAIFNLSRSTRLSIIIAISFTFFIVEISVGFYTRSLALVADAFHYLNDLIGFVVALIALKVSEKPGEPPSYLSFGWQRSTLLGAFFNGVFLLALGVSIILQSIERFVSLEKVDKPELILIIGCVGLSLNIISAFFIHEHGHEHHGHGHGHSHGHATPEVDAEHDQTTVTIELENRENAHENHRHATNSRSVKRSHDLGVMGVLLHVVGDAINNIGVIIAALVIWKATYEGRYYADPGVSLGIGLLILISAIPLVKNSGSILLDTVPLGVNLDDVQHDLETIPGVLSVHELHAWRLNQNKAIASAHVVTSDSSLTGFMARAQRIGECLHAYGIHSVTLQPELASSTSTSVVGEGLSSEEETGTGTGTDTGAGAGAEGLRMRRESRGSMCKIVCKSGCEALTCCG
ncbi:CDF family cation efflux system protein [Blastomyces parvus]|uniref:CDF family cation efflux system protein n=1 Tax=Blastomyces parvus TaxID=2060905 RepID=A0A2B7WMC2_9EURO|nr:CDF family cation efflux system protein [Blastomyces parvus]